MELSIYYKGCWGRWQRAGVCVCEREAETEGKRDRGRETETEILGKSLILTAPQTEETCSLFDSSGVKMNEDFSYSN